METTDEKILHFKYITLPPHPDTEFDESSFLKLLSESVGISIEQKQD